MKFRNREEALRFFGLESGATEEQIKMVYRVLAKAYHPDGNPDQETSWQFYDIRDAYDYLMEHPEVTEVPRGSGREDFFTEAQVSRSPQIFGAPNVASEKRRIREENARKERRRQQAKREEQKALQKKQMERRKIEEENRIYKEQQEREYREAMEKINAIRTARAIEAILNHYKEEMGEDHEQDV